MSRQHAFAFAGIVGVAALLGVAGCKTNPLAQQITAQRLANMRDTSNDLVMNEVHRSDRLPVDVAFVDNELKNQNRELKGNVALISNDFIRSIELWKQRQPEYRTEAATILRAHPEQIEETAIRMFY